MPRLPTSRGFDIRDKDADCYDATGQFAHLSASDAGEPHAAAAEPEVPARFSTGSGQPDRVDARAPARALLAWVLGAFALAALLAVVLAARGPERKPTPPAPGPAAAAVQAAPAPAVASPASGVPQVSERHPRSQPAPRRPRKRPVRRAPAPPGAITAPRPARPPAAPVRRPAPTPEPAGGEFILGAR